MREGDLIAEICEVKERGPFLYHVTAKISAQDFRREMDPHSKPVSKSYTACLAPRVGVALKCKKNNA